MQKITLLLFLIIPFIQLRASSCSQLLLDISNYVQLTKKEKAIYERLPRGKEVRNIGFRDKKHLTEHFYKHRNQFTFSSKSLSDQINEYEEMAMNFAESTNESSLIYKDRDYYTHRT